jgi:hypothetical protein
MNIHKHAGSEEFYLLGYNAAWPGENQSTYRGNIMSPSSGLKQAARKYYTALYRRS